MLMYSYKMYVLCNIVIYQDTHFSIIRSDSIIKLIIKKGKQNFNQCSDHNSKNSPIQLLFSHYILYKIFNKEITCKWGVGGNYVKRWYIGD